MNIELMFSTEDARQIFEAAGLEVSMQKFEYQFPMGPNSYTDTIEMLAVRNPFTNQWVRADKLFKTYILQKQRDLFLKPEKLEVFNLFKNQIK